MRVNNPSVDDAAIQQAARLLVAGDIVAFPTETVYGLGANAFSEQAVAKIFAAKGRPGDNPLIVHISSLNQVDDVAASVSDQARALMKAFWPGPLSIILPKSSTIPDSVTAGLTSVAVRFPSNPIAHALINAAGLPVAAPSANRSGLPSPTTASHVFDDMNGRIPLLLDGGPCAVGVESTVVDCTVDPPLILRPGAVTAEMMRSVIGEVAVINSAQPPAADAPVKSPGLKYKHYSPKTRVELYAGPQGPVRRGIIARIRLLGEEGKSAAWLGFSPDPEAATAVYELAPAPADLEEAARNLYDGLRTLDRAGVDIILAEAPPPGGIGEALYNRMVRAAAYQVIRVEEGD